MKFYFFLILTLLIISVVILEASALTMPTTAATGITRLNMKSYGDHDATYDSRIIAIRPQYVIDNPPHGLYGEMESPQYTASWLLQNVKGYQAAGIKVIGYVTSGYEGRGGDDGYSSKWYSLEMNKKLITNMATIDHVDGVFIDECSDQPGTASKAYLKALTDLAHSYGLITWGNVGVDDFDSWFFTEGGFDFMQSSEAWGKQSLSPVQRAYGSRISVTGYNSGYTANDAQRLTIDAWNKGLAYCYINTVEYTSIASWFEDYASRLRTAQDNYTWPPDLGTTPSPTPTNTNTPKPSVTQTPTATKTSTPTPSKTTTPTATQTSPPTTTSTPKPTSTPTSTSGPTPTPSTTTTQTPSATPSPSSTQTPTATPSSSATTTPSPTSSPPSGPTPGPTITTSPGLVTPPEQNAPAATGTGNFYTNGWGGITGGTERNYLMEYMETPGVFAREASVKAYDGLANILISKGTNFRTVEKWAGSYITFEPLKEDPPETPPDWNLISLIYKLGPEGATFDPQAQLNFIYDKDSVPEGINETDIEAAFYDGSAWQTMESRVAAGEHTVMTHTNHMGQYALIAKFPSPLSPAIYEPDSFQLSIRAGTTLPADQKTVQKSISAPEVIQEIPPPFSLISPLSINVPASSPSPVLPHNGGKISEKWIAASIAAVLGIFAAIIVYRRGEKNF